MVGRPRGLGPPGRALRTRSGLGGSDFTILGEMERSEQGSDVSAGSPYLNHAPHRGRGGSENRSGGSREEAAAVTLGRDAGGLHGTSGRTASGWLGDTKRETPCGHRMGGPVVQT